jgi:hypothetical protein
MKTFNYEELIDQVSKIEIKKEGDEVTTYFDKREVSRKRVSGRYEIFDFRPFTIDAINNVVKEYNILEYSLTLKGGIQEIKLISEPEEVNGEIFHRSFYLLNSSDKSRALNFSYGLKHKDFTFITDKGAVTKKHYTGITDYVNENVDIDDGIFKYMLETFDKLIGDQILMSNVQKIITESEFLDNSKKTLKKNFKDFLYYVFRNAYGYDISKENRNKLLHNLDYNNDNDFMIDSFLVIKCYLMMFRGKDSAIIKRESNRIAKLGVFENRVGFLEELIG